MHLGSNADVNNRIFQYNGCVITNIFLRRNALQGSFRRSYFRPRFYFHLKIATFQNR